MRWRRLCVDVDQDGRVRGASYEEYLAGDGQRSPDTLTVLAEPRDGATAPEVLELLLAEPWGDEMLPFPSHGWVVALGLDQSRDDWERHRFGPPTPPFSSGVSEPATP